MTRARVIAATAATPELLRSIRRLLDGAFADGFGDEDWEHTLGGWHAVVAEGPHVVAHAAVVPRTVEVGRRPFAAGYLEGVATAVHRRGEGLGSQVVAAATAVVQARFELGALSTGSPGFYERLGWERWRGPSFVRDGGALRRTEDEDAGLLVLRSGPSRDVDLHASITCTARPGDDW